MPRLAVSPVLLALTASLALSGCGTVLDPSKKQPPPCPPVYILGDAANFTKYRAGGGRDITDVEYEAEITGYKGACHYDDKGGIVELQVLFDIKRGPASTSDSGELTYFIAMPKFYPSETAKAVFTTPLKFPKGVTLARTTDDDVVMRFPIKNKEAVNDYEIYLGFQLSAEDLEFTRRSKK